MIIKFALTALVLGLSISNALAGNTNVNVRLGGGNNGQSTNRGPEMSPERFEELKGMMAERSASMLGEAPAGKRQEDYQYFDRKPQGSLCRTGYRQVDLVQDPELGRAHFRCVR